MLAPIVAAFEACRDQLTAAEQRLAQVLSSDPGAAAFLSGRELALRAGVHESAAVRLAQKLGYNGYPAFRRALREQQGELASPAARVARTLAVSGSDIWHTLLGKEVESLLACESHLDQKQLDAAASLIVRARQVHLWAAGNARVLAQLLDRRLRAAGVSARDISHEGRELAEHAVLLGRGDVLIAFAFRRTPPALPALLEHARESGTATLLIADMVGHTMRARPDVLLAAPRGDDEKFLTLSVPMLISNALVLTLAQRDRGRSISGLQTLQRLRSAFDPDGQ